MKTLRIIYTCLMFVIVAELLPKQIKEPIPKIWGTIEGTTGLDHTGFAFTPFGGQGNCRIVNARLALKTPGSKIVFGIVTPKNGRKYPHLWVTKDNQVLDLSCKMTDPNCQNRKMFAVIDPVTLALDAKNPTNPAEEYQVSWGLEYLSGLKKASQ